jgi:hypothetical protein
MLQLHVEDAEPVTLTDLIVPADDLPALDLEPIPRAKVPKQ